MNTVYLAFCSSQTPPGESRPSDLHEYPNETWEPFLSWMLSRGKPPPEPLYVRVGGGVAVVVVVQVE